ncbi:putative cyclic nucleotide-gated ion channel 13 [Prunus persica]|nr:putative cyclic nucleotide-gated ion channel 13 [Prunus persica]
MATGEVTVVVENIEGNMEGKTEATDNSKEKVASDRYSNSEATVKNSAMKDEDGSNKKEDENHDTRWGAFLQMWKKIFVVSCLFTVALDPLFLYVPMMKDDIKCLLADRNLKTTALLLRSLTDLFYIFDIIL